MEKLNPKADHSWDELVTIASGVIRQISEYLDVDSQYLSYSQNFMRSVLLNNKFIAVQYLNEAIERLNNIKSNE